jgi:hypothetical protein
MAIMLRTEYADAVIGQTCGKSVFMFLVAGGPHSASLNLHSESFGHMGPHGVSHWHGYCPLIEGVQVGSLGKTWGGARGSNVIRVTRQGSVSLK